MAAQLEEGDSAPDFDLPADGGGHVQLTDFRNRTLILYFYPKDDTEGCTKQAVGFTEQLKAFREAGADIVGVSRDSVKKHDRFKAKHALGILLASDENGDVCARYGVWKEKTLYGRKYMGIERSTFLIDGAGRIARIWRGVRVPGHVDQVLEAVKEIR